MDIKRAAVISLITFLIGGILGGAYAFSTHDNQKSLAMNIEQAHEDWEVEQFINEQEKQRPNGLEESRIETGSKYTGITYNAPAKTEEPEQPVEQPTVQSEEPQAKKSGIGAKLSGIFSKKQKDVPRQETAEPTQGNVSTGRINIQSGSLNVRAQGSSDGAVIGQVYRDDTVTILSQDGAWYHITTANGLDGYVSAAYVDMLDTE